MNEHSLWQFLHIVLFVYWLGADLGVFLASRYVARADLALDERLRFLELLLKLDMGPRTALIGIIPVGFMLGGNLGLLPASVAWRAAIWVVGLLWLALTWYLYAIGRDPRAAPLAAVDRAVRWTVAILFAALGALSLLRHSPIEASWLAGKFLCFAAIVVIGLILRGVIRDWAIGFGELRSGAAPAAANARIQAAYRRATRWAHTLWLLVAMTAFLGVVKPTLG